MKVNINETIDLDLECIYEELEYRGLQIDKQALLPQIRQIAKSMGKRTIKGSMEQSWEMAIADYIAKD